MARFFLALSFALIPACDGAGACADEPADVAALVARADADTLDAIAADVCPEDAAPAPEPRSVDGGAAPTGYVDGDAYPEDPFRWGCDLPPQDISKLTSQSCLIMLAACVDAQIGQCQDDAKACQALQQQCVTNIESACWGRLE
jgi:hypothetical protein